MFNHPRHRSRKRRQIKSLLKVLFFLSLFWALIAFGFRRDAGDLGEHLDRNQIERSKTRMRGGARKAVEESDEILKLDGDADEEEESAPGMQNILEEFLNKDKAAPKEQEKDTLLGGYAEEIKNENLQDVFHGVNAGKIIEAVGQVQNVLAGNDHPDDKVIKSPQIVQTNSPQNNPEVAELVEVEESENQNKMDDVAQQPEEANDGPRPDEADDEEITPYGDYGKAVTLPADIPENIQKLVTEGWQKHEFNEYVSNLIPFNRTLHDFRSDYCRDMQKVYSRILPTVSIVMVFHNEAWSTLMRSIKSIFNRTPANFINEVILVDDFSDMEHLKGPLSEFVSSSSKLSLIRLPERKGLIYARNAGAKAAKAKSEALVFLDSHIECTAGWLEPLLDRVLLNTSTIAVPVIEIINDDTFELEPKEHPRYVTLGGFNWNLQFRWFHKDVSELKEPQGPVESPTMAGGLFAISSKFFKHLGMYDSGLDLWGGENLELSFKAWMCGGSIEIVQCSHVGHVFRKKSPYTWRPGVNVLRKNSLRVAKVWMDDYSVFFNYATGFEKTDYGDISERVELRKRLKCKDFHWYMRNIYPEKRIPSHGIAYGQIQNLGYGGNRCLDGRAVKDSPSLSVHLCHGRGGNQFWEYNGEIARDNYCVTYDAHNLMTQHCKGSGKQLFTYDPDEKQIYIHQRDKCLTMTKDYNLIMEPCDKKLEGQRWKLENLKAERVKKF